MKKIFFAIICIFIMSNYINAWSEYKIGDEIEYKGIKFYVIEYSGKNTDTLKLLKGVPLKSDEMAGYLESTEILEKNVSTGYNSYNVVDLSDDYLKVTYYASNKCATNFSDIICSVDYSVSDVKQVVDVWASNYLDMDDLSKDSTGYKARLLTYDEMENNFKIRVNLSDPTDTNISEIKDELDWVFNNEYIYWTMSQRQDSDDLIWVISRQYVQSSSTYWLNYVRPVIVLKKSALGDENLEIDSKDDNEKGTDISSGAKGENSIVKVPNTLEKISILVIMIGIVLISISIVIVVKNKDKIRK